MAQEIKMGGGDYGIEETKKVGWNKLCVWKISLKFGNKNFSQVLTLDYALVETFVKMLETRENRETFFTRKFLPLKFEIE